MEINPRIIPFKKRSIRILKKYFWGLFFLLLYVLLRNPSRIELVVLSVIVISISGIYLFSLINKCKHYLGKIKIEGDKCEFIVYEYDEVIETYITNLSETRIKIVMLIFPFTHFGTSYKLVIETKRGALYQILIQQYEIGDWDLEKFKQVLCLYGKIKGVPVSPQSYKRTMF